MVVTLSLAEYQQRMEAGQTFDVVDVRSPGEFASVHIEGARNVPLPSVAHDDFSPVSDRPLLLVCQMGGRALTAANKLSESHADQELFVLDGGTNAWLRANLPVLRGKGVISLDRQIQIAVGLLISMGIVLGYSVSHWFFILPGVVGLGLLNAGITGICPLGMFIALMPWNRRSATKASCSVS